MNMQLVNVSRKISLKFSAMNMQLADISRKIGKRLLPKTRNSQKGSKTTPKVSAIDK